MSKNSKKRSRYNVEVIKVLSEAYSVSEQFVRQCIRRERQSPRAEAICNKYLELAGATLQKINEFKNNL